MRILYLDCGMGAAGDMLTAALLELLKDPDAFIGELNSIGIPGVKFIRESAVKCGIKGTHVSVTVNGEEEGSCDCHEHMAESVHKKHHGNAHLQDIRQITDTLPLSKQVKSDVLAVYNLIAEAESEVHGICVSEVHFHELGMMDALADVIAVCMLMERLAFDEVVVSPVHVGSGQVCCEHGILPVPAPATAYLLKDVPIYAGDIRGELCTPTGAALLKYFASRFDSMPLMQTKRIGYGMGKKDFASANCVRAFMGDAADGREAVLELSCNVDDMTAEEIGFAMERLFDAGALEVYTIPIGMKKSRPGTLIGVICTQDNKDRMVELLFLHTTTIGIRENVLHRYTLERTVEKIDTPYGVVHRKNSCGYGVTKSKYEYEDLARIAKELGFSIEQVRQRLKNTLG